jgi:hypothetical protein
MHTKILYTKIQESMVEAIVSFTVRWEEGKRQATIKDVKFQDASGPVGKVDFDLLEAKLQDSDWNKLFPQEELLKDVI